MYVFSQAVLHSLPGAPRGHEAMRRRVCDYLKDLPDKVKKDTIDVVFKGKPLGLTNLAYRQRKLVQWVRKIWMRIFIFSNLYVFRLMTVV